MRTMTSAVATAALLFAVAAGPASAQTWYKPAPASGVATGNLTFNTYWGPISCTVSTPWMLTGGYVRLGNITLSGSSCSQITVYQTFNMMLAPSPPGPTYNAAIIMHWESPPGSGICVASQAGLFDNSTSTVTVYGGASCTFSGTLTFPGLQLLP